MKIGYVNGIICIALIFMNAESLVNFYRTRKQKDLENDLEGMVKKNTDLMRVNAKLKSDLMQKETLVNAQGEEVSQEFN